MKKAGVTANAVIPVAATAMTKTIPYFRKAVEADERGESMPAFFRHELGFGTAHDVSGLVAFLASDAAAGVTGQAIGAGGDRLQLWTHPEAAATEYREGGWGYQDLVANFGPLFGDKLQSVGEDFLPLPAELQPEAEQSSVVQVR
jgi:3-oxoacyl-[acyl-carrier protein] reductase